MAYEEYGEKDVKPRRSRKKTRSVKAKDALRSKLPAEALQTITKGN